jgi:hypothetical protein
VEYVIVRAEVVAPWAFTTPLISAVDVVIAVAGVVVTVGGA